MKAIGKKTSAPLIWGAFVLVSIIERNVQNLFSKFINGKIIKSLNSLLGSLAIIYMNENRNFLTKYFEQGLNSNIYVSFLYMIYIPLLFKTV